MKVFNFEFQESKIRSVMIDNYIWFVAKDVFERLGLSWHANKLDSIPDDWKCQDKIFLARKGGDQKQSAWLINEQAFYRVVGNSNHPDAVEFSNKAAQFMRDLRLGRVGTEELALMRESVQQLYFDFVEVPHQRQVNHKRNKKSVRQPIDSYWRDLYEAITGMSFENKMAELRRRGVPSYKLSNSGQDGLRWFSDEYGQAIAFATFNRLTLDGYDKNGVRELVLEGLPFLRKLGEMVGEDNCLSKNYKPRKSKPKPEPNPDQMALRLN